MKTNFMNPMLLGLLLVSTSVVSAAPKMSLKGINKNNLITTNSKLNGLSEGEYFFSKKQDMVKQGDTTVSVMNQSGLISVHQRFGKLPVNQQFPLHNVPDSLGEARSSFELLEINGKSYRASWSKSMQRVEGQYSNHNFKATGISWDHRADIVNYDGRMIHQISPTDPQSKKNAVVLSLSSREAGKSTKVQKQVLFHLDSSYPEGSQILDSSAESDMSHVVVTLLDSKNKVTEYSFRVGEKDPATGYNKLIPFAKRQGSLSDYYAGDVVERTTVRSGSQAKGMSVSGAQSQAK